VPQAYDYEEIFRTMCSAIDREDMDGATAYLVEDSVVIDFSDPSTIYRGPAEIRSVIEGYVALFTDFGLDVIDVIVSGDRLAAELVFHGVPVGQSEAIEVRGAVFHTYRDGKLIAEHIFMDPANLPVGVELA
jgi:ketosteroid isomerase-like protein